MEGGTEREMLEEQLDFLLESLHDLEREREAGDIEDDDYLSLRDDYVARAAAISHQLRGDEIDRPDDTPPLPRRTWPRRIVAVLVVLSLAAGSGAWVASSAGQRLPGQSSSGGIEESTATRLSTARQLNFSDPTKAIEIYNAVLKVEPDNVEALTYRAWLIALTAREATGDLRDVAYATVLADLARARGADPAYPDAACFLGIIHFRFLGDAKSAKPAIDECKAMDPPAEVESFVDAISAEVEKALAG